MDDNHIVFDWWIYTLDAKRSPYFKRRELKNGKRTTRYLHRDIWEKYNGPIPDGFVIHHRDGNPLNNTLENLECVPEYEHRIKRYHQHKISTKPEIRRCGDPQVRDVDYVW
jgi:hypothetical protein